MAKKPKLTRIQKCKLATEKGFLYDEITGEITTPTGKKASRKNVKGYVVLTLRDSCKNVYYLYGHQFAWFIKYQETIELIDHINRINFDNRISNLRKSNKSKNAMNMKNVKGYYHCKRNNKYIAYISVNYKVKQLGTFDTPEQARNCYLENKSFYHKLN